ncbi:hypothetical protein M409DRAFT_60282 [Zasmidium cellare ATCC 36951]|uniref:Uncharacterized protein n=1 Tax=Zasmidium cellare ATCC 36951 TaxID=1080233 RepID=A0A6A6C2Q9_ZASCE|nr:uncharacterized protein M409DRAFT_60282 [Zasmidium cellare ATCC 36951]KAF2160019.1 hypothetical protein M409DRAFT_60282 [Zasmidium cellare ATCC 36951]
MPAFSSVEIEPVETIFTHWEYRYQLHLSSIEMQSAEKVCLSQNQTSAPRERHRIDNSTLIFITSGRVTLGVLVHDVLQAEEDDLDGSKFCWALKASHSSNLHPRLPTASVELLFVLFHRLDLSHCFHRYRPNAEDVDSDAASQQLGYVRGSMTETVMGAVACVVIFFFLHFCHGMLIAHAASPGPRLHATIISPSRRVHIPSFATSSGQHQIQRQFAQTRLDPSINAMLKRADKEFERKYRRCLALGRRYLRGRPSNIIGHCESQAATVKNGGRRLPSHTVLPFRLGKGATPAGADRIIPARVRSGRNPCFKGTRLKHARFCPEATYTSTAGSDCDLMRWKQQTRLSTFTVTSTTLNVIVRIQIFIGICGVSNLPMRLARPFSLNVRDGLPGL